MICFNGMFLYTIDLSKVQDVAMKQQAELRQTEAVLRHTQECSASAQVKAATAHIGTLKGMSGKKSRV